MGWPYQQKPPPGWPLDYDSGLVPEAGFWPMWEGSGNKVFDLSGNNNTGSLVADTHWVPGKFGSALSFDGTGDYVDIDNPVLGSVAMTIVVLARKAAYQQYAGLVVDYQAATPQKKFILGYENPENTLTFYVGDGTNTDSHSIGGFTQDIWHQVCGVFDGGQGILNMYLDGVESTSSTTITNIGATPNPISAYSAIGTYNTTTYPFNGQIDHVLIYNRALSASEIAELYSKPFCMFKDPAEIALLGAYQAVGVTVPVMTYHYKQAGGL